jgi:hypothetical protein
MTGSDRQIPVVLGLDAPKVHRQPSPDHIWQHGDPVLVALAPPHHQLAGNEIHVLHPEPERLEQAQAAAVEQPAHQTWRAGESPEQPAHLLAGQNDRQPARLPGPEHPREPADVALEHLTIKEEERTGGWVCVAALTRLSPASQETKPTMSSGPSSAGWRIP